MNQLKNLGKYLVVKLSLFRKWLFALPKKEFPFFDHYGNLILFSFFFVPIVIWQWANVSFFFRTNYIFLVLALPFVFLFLWLYERDVFTTKESFWTVLSVITAVAFFLFQNTNQESAKAFAIYTAHQYNCYVADIIISLDTKENKSENFSLNYFVTEPYLANVDLLYRDNGDAAGKWLLTGIYKMQAINSLIAVIQGLNIQGVNPLNSKGGYFVDMYNKQIIGAAKEIKSNLPCDSTLQQSTPFDSLWKFLQNFFVKK